MVYPLYPSLCLGNGLLSSVLGPLEASPTALQNVLVRRYAPNLAPVGDAITLDAGDNASDSRVVTFGPRFLVAMMTGRHQSARAVMTLLGVCP